MRNFSIYRADLSDENIEFLSKIKDNKEVNKEDNAPRAYKRTQNEEVKELNLLWQGFKFGSDEKSPGLFLMAGFIAGALCVFVLNSILSVSSNILAEETDASAMGQPKFEKKISRKDKIPQIALKPSKPQQDVIAAEAVPEPALQIETAPKTASYTVKSGDSMSSIVYRFFGRYDLNKTAQIKKINNLASENRLSIGQQLIIPLD